MRSKIEFRKYCKVFRKYKELRKNVRQIAVHGSVVNARAEINTNYAEKSQFHTKMSSRARYQDVIWLENVPFLTKVFARSSYDVFDVLLGVVNSFHGGQAQ